MVGNDAEIFIELMLNLMISRIKGNFFGSKVAKNAINIKHPADWLDSFGFEHPELRNFAIQILGLTRSSFDCEQN